MNKFFATTVFFIALFAGSLQAQQATNKTLDQIVAIVNDHIILQSDVDQRVREYMYQMQQQQNQRPSFSEDIWYTVLEDAIQNYVLLDQAAIDSVEVPQAQVEQQVNARLNSTIQQMGGEQAVEERMGQSIVQIRADMMEQYSEQLTVQRIRQTRMQKIDITRPEVVKFFNQIPQDSIPTIPEQVEVSQIVAIPAAREDARREARQLAETLRDSIINHGKSIEALAEEYSDGPSASRGGKLPMMGLNDLVSEYSAAASALKPGDISKVVETSFGFHVIRLNKRQGDQIDTNHILIEVDENSYDDQSAITRLEALKDTLAKNEDMSFADLARRDSEDPNTAPQGGRILNPQSGQRSLEIDQLDPSLYRIVLLLEDEGDISEPKPFNIGSSDNAKRAFRIVRLDKHTPEHTASLKTDYSVIKSYALQEKRYRIIQDWIDNLREQMYIEYKIPVPEGFASR